MDIDITPEKLIQLIYHELPTPKNALCYWKNYPRMMNFMQPITELKEQTHLLSHVQVSPSKHICSNHP